MNEVKEAPIRIKSALSIAGIVIIVVIAALVTMRLITGHGLGLWRLANLGRAVLDSGSVTSYTHGDFTNIIFLHHSTGQNLIEQGNVRKLFTDAGYSFWDHGYHWDTGLRRPDGSRTGYSYNIPDDNTDPDGLTRVFAQRVYSLPLNAFSGLLQHEVIIFKSCFPVSHITSNEQLKQYKSYYLSMRDVMDQHPDKIFIVMTPPPLNPAATDIEAAIRARTFANWLSSDEYLNGHPNIFTFDFFNHLAEDDPTSSEQNMLRQDYRNGLDSHPNQVANETIGPIFFKFVLQAVQDYRTVYVPSPKG